MEGKIFDDTPSGKKWKSMRDSGLELAKKNNHKMSVKYRRVESRTENSVRWECDNCNMAFDIDFNSGTSKGSSLTLSCPGRTWL